jgi:hypothetical protein
MSRRFFLTLLGAALAPRAVMATAPEPPNDGARLRAWMDAQGYDE